jgi:exodeoxyribonuclease VII large subunit
VTIADLVADRRALTPSEAGELVVPSARDLMDTLEHTLQRMRHVLRNRLERSRLQLAAIEARGIFQRPASLIDERRMQCEQLSDRLEQAIRLFLERRRQQLASIAAGLQALSPLQVLSRGYSLTTRTNGLVVRQPQDVAVGDELITHCQAVKVRSMVQEISTT